MSRRTIIEETENEWPVWVFLLEFPEGKLEA